MNRPAQLQINQSGAWRGVLVFDAGHVPDEFFQAAEDLVRLSGADPTMRIVHCQQSGSGAYTATQHVLMTWSRKTGWAKA